MPGYLIFEEFGVDFSKLGLMGKAARKGMQMVPGSWMMHGIVGESGIDVDPVAAMHKIADGESPVLIDLEPYKGWIEVASISQTVSSTAEIAKRDLINELEEANNLIEQQTQTNQPLDAASGLNDPLKPPSANGGNGRVYKTGMTGAGDGVERLEVEVHVDAAFPHLLKTALSPKKITGGQRKKDFADIHMCTHAAIDLNRLTFGSTSPAATMIKTLLAAGLADVVPYLSIHMEDVSVEAVNFNLLGDADGTVPTANITLEYETIKWTYHVINGSNMNLFDVDFEYDVKKRKPPSSLFSLGNMLNPFT